MNEDTSLKRKWRGRLIRYAPFLFWLIVVLGFSSEQASSDQTSRLIRPILEFLFPHGAPETLDLYHALVRKAAHLTEYGLLGFLAVRAFAGSTLAVFRRHRFLAAAVIAVLVASVDEYHQSFETSRTASGWDVMLDALGGVIGSSVFWIWMRYRTRKKEETTFSHP